MTGFSLNTRNRYKCNLCDHKSYKTWSGANNHVEKEHSKDLELANALQEITRLKNQPPQVKERIVYKEETKPEYWEHAIFCIACKEVMAGGRIPRGQTIEQTPHSRCGTKSLVPIERGL